VTTAQENPLDDPDPDPDPDWDRDGAFRKPLSSSQVATSPASVGSRMVTSKALICCVSLSSAPTFSVFRVVSSKAALSSPALAALIPHPSEVVDDPSLHASNPLLTVTVGRVPAKMASIRRCEPTLTSGAAGMGTTQAKRVGSPVYWICTSLM
jgi:hypothetical protein